MEELHAPGGVLKMPHAAQCGPRRLIINADDFGESRFNRSIESGLKAGFLTSSTLLVGRPGAEAAAAMALRSGFSIGLHLNLTAGQPVAPSREISTLIGPTGQFLGP